MKYLRSFGRALYSIYIDFDNHDGWAIASHIALATLMAIFPFLIFMTALTGTLATPNIQSEVTRLMFDYWPHVVAEPIVEEVNKVLGNSTRGLVTFSAILAFYLASNAVEAVRIGVNRAYRVQNERPFWLNRLQSLLFIIAAALTLVTLATMVVLWPVLWAQATRLATLIYDFDLNTLAPLISMTRYAITFVVLGGVTLIVQYYLPAGRRRLRDIIPGTVLTLLLWLAGGYGFSVYLTDFSSYSRTYARLAGVVVALFFLWLVSVAFLFGAEFNAWLIERKAKRRARTQRRSEAWDQAAG